MELAENNPFDPAKIGALITNKDDMFLVWPVAKWPFDSAQWMEALDLSKGHRSFIVHERGKPIGHAALRKRDAPGCYMVSFLYLLPEHRAKGLGRHMVAALEQYAAQRLGANKLQLVVRDYNQRAIRCYLQCGFREMGRDGTRIDMEKKLSEETERGQPTSADVATRAAPEK